MFYAIDGRKCFGLILCIVRGDYMDEKVTQEEFSDMWCTKLIISALYDMCSDRILLKPMFFVRLKNVVFILFRDMTLLGSKKIILYYLVRRSVLKTI